MVLALGFLRRKVALEIQELFSTERSQLRGETSLPQRTNTVSIKVQQAVYELDISFYFILFYFTNTPKQALQVMVCTNSPTIV